MLLSKGSVKRRSLGLSSFVLALTVGVAAAGTAGCFFVDSGHGGSDDSWDDGDDVTNPPDPPVTTITQVSIQPDQLLQATPGEGVGIFVEYNTGGKWHVWTTCDTFVSKSVCAFDIFAGSSRIENLHGYAADQVEGFDSLTDLGDGTVELLVDTDSDVDGLVLDMEPGAPLTLEVYLDGQSAAPFVYWVSGDVIHTGAPDNPVDFAPTGI